MSIYKLVSGVLLINFFLGFPQDESTPTEVWSPVPVKINANNFTEPPSDAMILFDGKDFSNWVSQYSNEPPNWKINSDGSMSVVNGTGGIRTRESFGSVQLHVEWKTSEGIRNNKPQYNSNSGVFLQGQYELQILDSYQNPTYVNGQAGSIYKQHAPQVNSSKKPGEWQSYDIIFNAPVFNKKKLIKPAFFTVFQNGVLIQNHAEVQGATTNVGLPKYNSHENMPIVLQDHPSLPLSFRNIWIRKIAD
mgnify:CR=1 FL=1|jgi:hypothetical protein